MPRLVIRIGRDQKRHRAVTLRDHHLRASVRVARVAMENGIVVILLRLMIEDQHDFAAGSLASVRIWQTTAYSNGYFGGRMFCKRR